MYSTHPLTPSQPSLHHQIFKCAIEEYRKTIVDCAGYGISYDTQAGNSRLAKTKAHVQDVFFSFITIF